MRSRFAAHAAKKARRAQLLARAPRISPTIERDHTRDVTRLVRAYHSLILRAMTPQLRQDIDWRSLKDKARQMSEAFRATAFQTAQRLEHFSKSEAVRTLGDLASDLTESVGDFALDFAADAVLKLGGLLDASLEAAQDAYIEGALVGEEVGTFTLQGLLEGWLSRAGQSATNQVTQATAELNQSRQRDMGVRQYVWLAMRDGKTRYQHAALDGEECSYDDPPLSADKSSSGEACHPGEDYGCRCMAAPVLTDGGGGGDGDGGEEEDADAA
jgi:SPP1 gp7 family putative phage head morphogenesis protein